MKLVNFLKSRLVFDIFYCFWMFVNNHFTFLTCAISKIKMRYNVESSTYYFIVKTKILLDFQICISVPLLTSYMFCFWYLFSKNNPRRKNLTQLIQCWLKFIKFRKDWNFLHFLIDYPVQCYPEKATLMQNIWSWYLMERVSESCKTLLMPEYFNPLSANPTKWSNTRK